MFVWSILNYAMSCSAMNSVRIQRWKRWTVKRLLWFVYVLSKATISSIPPRLRLFIANGRKCEWARPLLSTEFLTSDWNDSTVTILVVTDRLALLSFCFFLYSCVHIRRASSDFLSFYLLRFLSTNGIHVFVCAVFVLCCIEVIFSFVATFVRFCRHCHTLWASSFIVSLFLDRRIFSFSSFYSTTEQTKSPSSPTSLTHMTFGQRHYPSDTGRSTLMLRLLLLLLCSSRFDEARQWSQHWHKPHRRPIGWYPLAERLLLIARKSSFVSMIQLLLSSTSVR